MTNTPEILPAKPRLEITTGLTGGGNSWLMPVLSRIEEEKLAENGRRLGQVATGVVYGQDPDIFVSRKNTVQVKDKACKVIREDAHWEVTQPKRFDLTRHNIERRANEIAQQLRHDFAGQELTLLTIQNGAQIWSDLIREQLIHLNQTISRDSHGKHLEPVTLKFDNMTIKSYVGTQRVNGDFKIQYPKMLDGEHDLSGANILVLEDVVDTGSTIEKIRELFTPSNIKKTPPNLKICAMLDKPAARDEKKLVPLEYCGFSLIGKPFVVGMGLDIDDYLRALGEVRELDEV
jgi:hypoxanthine phosphoribosyltransferase